MVSWGCYVFFLWNIGSQKEQIKILKAEMTSYENQHNEIRGMITFFEGTKDRIEDMKGYFLLQNEKNIVAFIKKIENLGKETGVDLKISNLDRGAGKILSAKVEIIGDWRDVNETITSIELIPYKISIVDLKLRKEDSHWAASLMINVLMM